MERKGLPKNLVETLNFSVDLLELRNYYHILETQYQEYIWRGRDYKNKDEFTSSRIYTDTNYGWAITTEVLDENIKSCPPWPQILSDFSYRQDVIKKERNTDLVFGIVQKILNEIPYALSMSLTVFPPGAVAIPHNDQDFLLRVHIPIYTDKDVKWLTNQGYYNMHQIGQAYLCDAREVHAVYNDSLLNNRVHLMFAIKANDIEKVKSIKGTFK